LFALFSTDAFFCLVQQISNLAPGKHPDLPQDVVEIGMSFIEVIPLKEPAFDASHAVFRPSLGLGQLANFHDSLAQLSLRLALSFSEFTHMRYQLAHNLRQGE
jgi:hypothetical protein